LDRGRFLLFDYYGDIGNYVKKTDYGNCDIKSSYPDYPPRVLVFYKICAAVFVDADYKYSRAQDVKKKLSHFSRGSLCSVLFCRTGYKEIYRY